MDNFYVYQHLDDEGNIVYIGKGRYARAWRHERRNSEHSKWMGEQLPFLKVCIVWSDLDETKALELERKMIEQLQPKFNTEYTKDGLSQRKAFGHWLHSNHSRFTEPELQKELGQRAAKSENHPNNKKLTCIHCGVIMNVGHIKRYHNDNCKQRVSINDTNRT